MSQILRFFYIELTSKNARPVQCLIRKIDGLKMEKTVRLQKFKDDLKSLQFTEIQNFIPKWEQIVDKYRGDEKYENVMTYFYNNFLLKYPIQNWNYSILPEYCKRTNGYLEKNNRKLNEKINHRKPGLNSLIHILKKEEDQQAIKYYAKLFKETTKNKNYFYNEKDLEKRIQEEKQDWTRIVDKLRKKEYFPPQQEKTINYKTIINNYDVEDILITRKKFKNRPIKKNKQLRKII
ncbi:hypothetical protein M0813_23144 [Anaeramoeba flamelloides]|uniref:Uncharacterized protein n=1 Tax=Anaeramoeba flamelloides TaxID=1746091 RepID=A0ABQ8Y9L4_9EUKA|nr:hypothetical protein M0813_23144 [Anaeramoeba flamelloides]